MSYEVTATVVVVIEAETPEEAALAFGAQLEDGLDLAAVVDVDDEDDEAVDVMVSERTGDGREITYIVALGNQPAVVRAISEHRPFSLGGGT